MDNIPIGRITTSKSIRIPCRNALSMKNKSKVFKCDDHQANLCKKLQTFYEQKEFFDVTLVAKNDNTRLQAHRMVLSASSDYFLDLFRSNFAEAKADEIELKEIDGVVLKAILKFMYTASIEIDGETVEEILRAAHFYQIISLVNACCDFMGEHIDVGNCLGISLFAEQHNYTDLYQNSIAFAFGHFEELCKEIEFFKLNEDELIKLISKDELSVSSEENVFLGVLAWVKYDEINREHAIFRLMSHIRFQLLTPKFIFDNACHSAFKTTSFNELTHSWLQWHLSPEKQSKNQMPCAVRKKSVKSNYPMGISGKLVFLSGLYKNETKIRIYNPYLNSWEANSILIPLTPRISAATIIIDSKLIVCGGIVNEATINSVECFDFKTNEITSMPPMKSGLSGHRLVKLNDDLYAIGGRDESGITYLVQKYDFSKEEWQYVASIPLSDHTGDGVFAIINKKLLATYKKKAKTFSYCQASNRWTVEKHFNAIFELSPFRQLYAVTDNRVILTEHEGGRHLIVKEYNYYRHSLQLIRLHTIHRDGFWSHGNCNIFAT